MANVDYAWVIKELMKNPLRCEEQVPPIMEINFQEYLAKIFVSVEAQGSYNLMSSTQRPNK